MSLCLRPFSCAWCLFCYTLSGTRHVLLCVLNTAFRKHFSCAKVHTAAASSRSGSTLHVVSWGERSRGRSSQRARAWCRCRDRQECGEDRFPTSFPTFNYVCVVMLLLFIIRSTLVTTWCIRDLCVIVTDTTQWLFPELHSLFTQKKGAEIVWLSYISQLNVSTCSLALGKGFSYH